jgi:hypothetical protein
MPQRRPLRRWRLSAADWLYQLRLRIRTSRRSRGQAPLRPTLRRWSDSAADWLYQRKFAEPIIFGVCLVVSAALVAGAFLMTSASTTRAPPADVSESPKRPERQPIQFVNQAGGYSFAYPQTWDLTQEAAVSRLESRTARIVVTFGVSFANRLERVTTRMVRSRFGPTGEGKMIGTGRQRIAGAPAFLNSGMTRDETGRPTRYLAIAIDGDSRTYTILITVPAHADPEMVLTPVERVVTSFETSSDTSLLRF